MSARPSFALQAAQDELSVFFVNHLAPVLLKVFADSVERIREDGIALYSSTMDTASVVDQLPSLLQAAIPVFASRIGVSPFNEDSEEIRLLLVQLLLRFLTHPSCRDVIASNMDSVVTTLSRVASDAFPAVKVEAAKAVQALCTIVPDHIRGSSSALVKCMLGNTGHQRGNVRTASVRALGRIMPLAGEACTKLMAEVVLPGLTPRLLDRTSSVRKAVTAVLCEWLHELPAACLLAHTAALLRHILSAIADQHEDVAQAALVAFHAAAVPALASAMAVATASAGASSASPTDLQVAAEAADGTLDEATPAIAALQSFATVGLGADDAIPGYEEIILPSPFRGRPPAQARQLVCAHLSAVLPVAQEDLLDWKSDTRTCAAGAVRSALVYSEGAVTPLLEALLPVLCRATTDDAPEVVAYVNDCAALVGAFVAPAAQLQALLPQVRGELAGMAGLEHRAAALAVMANAVSGMDPEQFAPHISEVCAAVGDAAFSETTPEALPRALAAAVGAVAEVGAELACSPAHNQAAALQLLRAALHLRCNGQAEEAQMACDALLGTLVEMGGGASLQALVQPLAGALLAGVKPSLDEWNRSHPARCELDACLRLAPLAFAEAMPALLEVFRLTLSPSRDADLRLAQLALLDATAASFSQAAAGTEVETFRMMSSVIVRDMLTPNLVWQVGAVASTVRKVCMACLHTIVKGGLLPPDAAAAVWPQLFPRLNSILSDDDETTRHIAVLVLAALLKALPKHLDDEGVRVLYPELLKRLDDSSDKVRICACAALEAMPAACAPGAMRGGPTEYTLDALLIHMDDTDEGMQRAAAAAAAAYAQLDGQYAAKAVAAARLRHRSPDLCDALAASMAGQGAAAE